MGETLNILQWVIGADYSFVSLNASPSSTPPAVSLTFLCPFHAESDPSDPFTGSRNVVSSYSGRQLLCGFSVPKAFAMGWRRQLWIYSTAVAIKLLSRLVFSGWTVHAVPLSRLFLFAILFVRPRAYCRANCKISIKNRRSVFDI